MTVFLLRLIQLYSIDTRIIELEKDIELYQLIVVGLVIVLGLLIAAVVLQRMTLAKLRGDTTPKNSKIKKMMEKLPIKSNKKKGSSAGKALKAKQNDLPDPGLIFKYSLAKENVMDKQITIGQLEGNIKTFSTEIIDDHLSVYIRIVENRRERDIYNLPDKITEEYQLDLRRDGKVLIFYPGLDGFREMGSRERVYIKEEKDEAGDPTFPSIPAKSPIRFRIGDRLSQEGKFINGYFEFHLFTQDYEVKTKTNIPKIEKNFLIRLYKIYPGYDTSSINEDGLYAMVDPFTTG